MHEAFGEANGPRQWAAAIVFSRFALPQRTMAPLIEGSPCYGQHSVGSELDNRVRQDLLSGCSRCEGVRVSPPARIHIHFVTDAASNPSVSSRELASQFHPKGIW